jgi:hypothetical protein
MFPCPVVLKVRCPSLKIKRRPARRNMMRALATSDYTVFMFW